MKAKKYREDNDCGQGGAYPQDDMCVNTVLVDKKFVIQNPSGVDTMLVQGFADDVNR